jgi:phosphonopyruvate decarboxylase
VPVIDAGAMLAELLDHGVREVTGVPCSYLTPLINRVASDQAVAYLPATHEGEALAIASGAWLAGSTTVVIAQNSGLGNMVNPLTSLNYPCRIPVPLIVTWRGEPGRPDEPQHDLPGRIMLELLDLMRVGRTVLPTETPLLHGALAGGWAAMRETQLPHAFILRGGTLAEEPINEPEPAGSATPGVVTHAGGGTPSTRIAALECLLGVLPDSAAIVTTTGKTSRELFTLADRPQHFYLVGAMGSASALGLGIAGHTSRLVTVIDGDGAMLMRFGTLATIGAHPAANLVHILLDNHVHDSTGGQRTLASQVDFTAAAAACGYAQVHACRDLPGFSHAIKRAEAGPGPTFIHLPISPGSLPGLGRPNLAPRTVARRFREFVTGTTDVPATPECDQGGWH